jgi:pimeloyl-ACP methyl ester carboxylesterase
LNIHYYYGGKGEPLLVLHGGNSHAGPWAKNLRELSQKYTLYVPDLPGFGLSQKMEGEYYIPELVKFVRDFTNAVELENFYLMGHSLGGGVAASYTIQYPEQVKKLILIDSMCMGDEIAVWVRMLSLRGITHSIGKGIVGLLSGAKWIVEGIFHSFEFILPVSEASLIIGSGATNLQVQTTVLTKRLSEIVVPTLIVWGDKDSIVPVKQAYAAATLIPDCQLRIMSGGHSAYQERLIEFSQTVSTFLD